MWRRRRPPGYPRNTTGLCYREPPGRYWLIMFSGERDGFALPDSRHPLLNFARHVADLEGAGARAEINDRLASLEYEIGMDAGSPPKLLATPTKTYTQSIELDFLMKNLQVSSRFAKCHFQNSSWKRPTLTVRSGRDPKFIRYATTSSKMRLRRENTVQRVFGILSLFQPTDAH